MYLLGYVYLYFFFETYLHPFFSRLSIMANTVGSFFFSKKVQSVFKATMCPVQDTASPTSLKLGTTWPSSGHEVIRSPVQEVPEKWFFFQQKRKVSAVFCPFPPSSCLECRTWCLEEGSNLVNMRLTDILMFRTGKEAIILDTFLELLN